MEGYILDEIFTERLKNLIDDYKKEHKLTHKEIAKQLGYKSKATISKYANGQITKIGPTGIRKLAVFFGVSPSWLAGFSDKILFAFYNVFLFFSIVFSFFSSQEILYFDFIFSPLNKFSKY